MDIPPQIAALAVIYSIFFLQNASPGVNVMAVMGTSMSSGRKSGIALGIGVALGTLTWSSVSVAGLAAVIVSYSSALIVIKFLGAAYLFWLAYKSLKSAFAKTGAQFSVAGIEALSASQCLWRGYIVNMTNPKAALGWLAIVSLGLKEDSPVWMGLSIIAGTTLISLTVHMVYALVFSTPKMIELYGKARRPIQGALGVFFVYAGQRLLTAKL